MEPEEPSCGKSKRSVGRPCKVDSFDDGVIKRATLKLMSSNKTVTLRTIRAAVSSAGLQVSDI